MQILKKDIEKKFMDMRLKRQRSEKPLFHVSLLGNRLKQIPSQNLKSDDLQNLKVVLTKPAPIKSSSLDVKVLEIYNI